MDLIGYMAYCLFFGCIAFLAMVAGGVLFHGLIQ